MVDLRRQSADIMRLAKSAPSPSGLDAVTAALDSKWEGIQAAGLKVLGAWGGRRSIKLLKGFLQEAVQREAAWSIRGVAIRNLAPLLDSRDAKWVLQLYFTLPTVT